MVLALPDVGPVVMPDRGAPSHTVAGVSVGGVVCDGVVAATVVDCVWDAWIALRQLCELVAVPHILTDCVRRTVLRDRVYFQGYVAGFSPLPPVNPGGSMLRMIQRVGG